MKEEALLPDKGENAIESRDAATNANRQLQQYRHNIIV